MDNYLLLIVHAVLYIRIVERLNVTQNLKVHRLFNTLATY